MYGISGSDFELSMAESDHLQGRLLGFYLSPGVTGLTYEDVLEMCLRENKYENRRDLERKQEKARLADQALIKCKNALQKAERRYLDAPRQSVARRDRQRKKNLLETEVDDYKEEIYQRRQQEEYLECLLQGLSHNQSRLRADAVPDPFRTATSSAESDDDEDSTNGSHSSWQEGEPTPYPEEDHLNEVTEDLDAQDVEMDIEAEDLQAEVTEVSGVPGEVISQAREDELLGEVADDSLVPATGPATPHLSQAITGLRVSGTNEDDQTPSPEGE